MWKIGDWNVICIVLIASIEKFCRIRNISKSAIRCPNMQKIRYARKNSKNMQVIFIMFITETKQKVESVKKSFDHRIFYICEKIMFLLEI